MNIKQAKQQIINTVKAYIARDEFGRYLIPQHRQRPVFLMGPPGIGKTEIMTQAAAELGIGILSYSMTHHTRQSALGLPIIKQREYFGKKYDVSEYTVSEIIGEVLDLMAETGLENGILFLDEINCVSETLTPVMLQFLQYKIFGTHKLPEGWVVITAGNPPEYNSSVREFDIVTWDRLKRIDIEPDLEVWKSYAYEIGVHTAVLTYLEIKPASFYKIEKTAEGMSFVTARGWDDLSRILKVYECQGIEADKGLMGQYLQNPEIAEDFAAYYELYRKYKSDYRITEILEGKADNEIIARAKAARFDERYSLIGLLLEKISLEAKAALDDELCLSEVVSSLQPLKGLSNDNVYSGLEGLIKSITAERERLKAANSLTSQKDDFLLKKLTLLESYRRAADKGFEGVKAAFYEDRDRLKARISDTKIHFSGMFGFLEKAFDNGQELLILVTELAANAFTARFISDYGCEEYHRYDKEFMFYQRRLDIIDDLNNMGAW